MKLDSTLIDSATYDAEKQELTLTFATNGKSYVYIDVPPEKWQALQAAKSAGKYFHANLKGHSSRPGK